MEKLFDGEYRLMEVLWESAPVNSTQLVTLCREQLGWTKRHHLYGAAQAVPEGGGQKRARGGHPAADPGAGHPSPRGGAGGEGGGMAPFLNAFFSGRKLTMEEALELKDLIDQHTWED